MKFTFKKKKLEFNDFIAAHERIRNYLQTTPLTVSHNFSLRIGHKVSFKWENKFKTGAFKERGALNFLLSLTEKEKAAGICAASAGNHALALSYHAAKLGINCKLIMPVNAPLVKVQSCQKNGATIVQFGETFYEAYEEAQKICKKEKRVFVSPFDDERIIAGQASCGLEILEQCEDFDSIIVPVGGGGLISGIASVIKERKPSVFILGVQSEWVTNQTTSTNAVKTDTLIVPATIAEGIAVKKIGVLNEAIIKEKVDKLISVSENEIAKALVDFLEKEKSVIEGAAAAAIAALSKNALPENCKSTVVVISGSNIDINVLSRLLERDMAERNRLLNISLSVPDRPGSLHLTTGIIAKTGANVLQVSHDRSFSRIPGNVEITFLLEVRNETHKHEVISVLEKAGLLVKKL